MTDVEGCTSFFLSFYFSLFSNQACVPFFSHTVHTCMQMCMEFMTVCVCVWGGGGYNLAFSIELSQFVFPSIEEEKAEI